MGHTAMKVRISAPKQDQGTAHIAEAVREPLRKLGEAVSGDYGGSIEHLWIDFELVPADSDHRPSWGFRFQKRVSPRPIAAGLPKHEYSNVGHYSVRPDYFALAAVPPEQAVRYVLDLVYESTVILEQQRNKLGTFEVAAFRAALSKAIRSPEVAP